MKTRDVVISGGGVPGLILASLLGQAGLDVTVIEPAPFPAVKDLKPSGRTAALVNDSLSVLEHAGVWKSVQDHATDLKILSIIDTAERTDFKSTELGQDRFGCNIAIDLLRTQSALHVKTLKTVEIVQSSVAQSAPDTAGMVIELANGEQLRAALLVGADGRASVVREQAGIKAHEHDYGQMAITALLSHTLPHQFTSTEIHRPGGPFTLVPMAGRTSSLVWLEKTPDAERILKLPKQDFEQHMQDISEGLLGELSLLTSPQAWPLKIMKAKSLTAPRVALIAEAAHVISPIGAQGLNLSLRDVRALAEEILQARSYGLDIGSKAVLQKYERNRQTDIDLRTAGTHAFNEIVASANPALGSVRRMGLKLIASVPPLRSLSMREGLAPDQATISGRTTRARVRTSTR